MTGGELFAFVVDPNSQGVWVAAGDVDGDGRADLITGAGSGAPVVRVFSGTDRRTLAAYPAFDPLVMDGLIPGQRYGWNAGVRVGVVDTDGDGNVEVAAGAGAGLPAGGRIHDPLSGGLLREPLALTPAFLGGIFVGGI
jgi:hypothetical protein